MSKNLEALRTQLTALSAADLRERFRAATGERPKSPNRAYQIRVIIETLAKKKPRSKAAPVTAEAAADKPRGRFAHLSIHELQGMYESTLGRPTNSNHRAYLIWKIREAEAGRVKIGPRAHIDPGEKQVLPLTLALPTVEALDTAWKQHGFKNRTAFLRAAIGDKLKALGEDEAAARFGVGSEEE